MTAALVTASDLLPIRQEFRSAVAALCAAGCRPTVRANGAGGGR